MRYDVRFRITKGKGELENYWIFEIEHGLGGQTLKLTRGEFGSLLNECLKHAGEILD